MRTALVLSGGGARGAYEVGVVSYLKEVLEPELGTPLPFDILCGTSVGAMHACFLAATADTPREQPGRLRELWGALKLEELLRFDACDVGSLVRTLLSRSVETSDRQTALVNSAHLRDVVLRHIPWKNIGRLLRRDQLTALSVTATHVGSGEPTVFLQRGRSSPPWPSVPLRAFETLIGPRHALASAAIPLLFPPVLISKQLYVDGGLKMNVPLAPALYLGADRVIVVSLRPAVPAGPRVERDEEHAYATGPFLMGKALNALMADHTTQDLDRLRQINRLLEAGTRAYGNNFLEVMAQAAPDFPFRPIREIVVHPSRDVGALAADYVRSRQFGRKHRGLPGKVLRTLAEREARSEAGLVSYLLFDRAFAQLLWELGRADAEAMRQQWLAFWAEPAQPRRLSVVG